MCKQKFEIKLNYYHYLKPLNCVQTNELCRQKLSVLNNKTWNHLTVYKQMNSGPFKIVTYKLFVYKDILDVCVLKRFGIK